MQYFNSKHAAARYSAFRPKVHDIALGWLAQAVPSEKRFRQALDVACGTGDSMMPLLRIADQVEGVDRSAAMVEVARSRGFEARQLAVEELEAGNYDLLSVCMAYHWFVKGAAVAGMKRASADESIWLIYNFALKGNDRHQALDDWLRYRYLRLFPSPLRPEATFAPVADPELLLLKQGEGSIPVSFSRDELLGYLTTQTNVEAVLSSGSTYEDVDRLLLAELPGFGASHDFQYAFSDSIVLFSRGRIVTCASRK